MGRDAADGTRSDAEDAEEYNKRRDSQQAQRRNVNGIKRQIGDGRGAYASGDEEEEAPTECRKVCAGEDEKNYTQGFKMLMGRDERARKKTKGKGTW